jgi:ABC-type lipoprotein release transport system permease subunit
MMSFDTAGEYLAMEGAATEIDIRLGDREDVDRRIDEIRRIVSDIEQSPRQTQALSVHSWEDLAKDYLAIAEAKRGGTGLILFLVFIISAVGISNTMLMAIYERIRELGMMRALGMSDRSIQAAFMLEAGGIGLIGSIFGLLLGIALNTPFIIFGIDLGFLLRDMDMGYRIQSVFRGVWNIEAMAVAFVAGMVLSMIVAWIPTRRALRMDIPACLRHQ